jgi:hypothetical protein
MKLSRGRLKPPANQESDFVQEFLTATFGDLIGNFIRTSELVALMDQEMARMAGTVLSEHVYDLEMTQAGHREFCRILGIKNNDDLQRIMLAGMPYLQIRAGQLRGLTAWQGNSCMPHCWSTGRPGMKRRYRRFTGHFLICSRKLFFRK